MSVFGDVAKTMPGGAPPAATGEGTDVPPTPGDPYDEELQRRMYMEANGMKTYPVPEWVNYQINPSDSPYSPGGLAGMSAQNSRNLTYQGMDQGVFGNRKAYMVNDADRGAEWAARNQENAALAESVASARQAGAFTDAMGADRAMYLNAAQGNVPSAAELQQRQGLAEGMRQSLGLAATSRSPGAFYNAQQSADRLQGSTIAQMGALRAQEQAQARTALTERDAAEANARNLATAQGLGVAQGYGSVGAGARAMTAQELETQYRNQLSGIEQSKANDAMRLGMIGAGNQYLGTADALLRTDEAERIAQAQMRAQFEEDKMAQFQQWLAQWVANQTGVRAEGASKQGSAMGAGGALLAALLTGGAGAGAGQQGGAAAANAIPEQ